VWYHQDLNETQYCHHKRRIPQKCPCCNPSKIIAWCEIYRKKEPRHIEEGEDEEDKRLLLFQQRLNKQFMGLERLGWRWQFYGANHGNISMEMEWNRVKKIE
jgi:hypothetical protein